MERRKKNGKRRERWSERTQEEIFILNALNARWGKLMVKMYFMMISLPLFYSLVCVLLPEPESIFSTAILLLFISLWMRCSHRKQERKKDVLNRCIPPSTNHIAHPNKYTHTYIYSAHMMNIFLAWLYYKWHMLHTVWIDKSDKMMRSGTEWKSKKRPRNIKEEQQKEENDEIHTQNIKFFRKYFPSTGTNGSSWTSY